jgi:DNA repair ATPase RecN
MDSKTTRKMVSTISLVTSTLIMFPFHCQLFIGLPTLSQCFLLGSTTPAKRKPRPLVTFLQESTLLSDNNNNNNNTNEGTRLLNPFNLIKSEDSNIVDNAQQWQQQNTRRRISMITSIRCRNLAGIVDTKRSTSSESDDEYTSSEIVLNLEDCESHTTEQQLPMLPSCNLVAVTGETGSGKSFLISKIVDLATGGKATASLLRSSSGSSSSAINSSTTNTTFDGTSATADVSSRDGPESPPPTGIAEVVLALHHEAHVSVIRKILRKLNLDAESILQAGIKVDNKTNKNSDTSSNRTDDVSVSSNTSTPETYYIRLKRTLSLKNGSRVKSSCFINDYPVSLKAMKEIGTPLVAIVDAPAAAAALGKAESRMQMIDAGVPSHLLLWVKQLDSAYRRAKIRTRSLEKELAKRTLPRSLSGMDRYEDSSNNNNNFDVNSVNDKTLDLMHHWDEELDGFQRRISNLQHSLRSSSVSSIDSSAVGIDDSSGMAQLLEELESLEWMENDNTGTNHNTDDETSSRSISSTLYRRLLDLLDLLKSLDARIVAASEARERLASRTLPHSARTALEQTRKLLLDATTNMGRDGPPKPRSRTKNSSFSRPIYSSVPSNINDDAIIQGASEKAHQLLNSVEDALLECSNFLDDDDYGLTATLRSVRGGCTISVESLYEYITEWNTLARKHGVSPYQLPSTHATLKEELDGGNEAKKLLPQAKIEEECAKKELMAASMVLTDARSNVCRRFSESVSKRLPLLGMEDSIFEARIVNRNKSRSSSSPDAGLWNEVDFYLHHQQNGDGRNRGEGRLENVASSGEKARILLAMECEIAGSIQALCSGTTLFDDKKTKSNHKKNNGENDEYHDDNGNNTDDNDDDDDYYCYRDWSIPPVAVIYDEIDAHVGGRATISIGQMLSYQSRSCQVFSITHSASLAAIATTHIRIQRAIHLVQPPPPTQQQQQHPSSSSSSSTATGATAIEGGTSTTTIGRRHGGTLRGDGSGSGGGSSSSSSSRSSSSSSVVALTVDIVTGTERKREVARMASGDMVLEEAEIFAEALLRDAAVGAVPST